MGWGSDETRLFVELYLGHKCLWNIEDEDYKNKSKRLDAYRDISKKFYALTEVNLNEVKVRNKVKSLRSTYTQYMQKLSRERKPVDSINNSSLTWIKDIHKCFSSINIPRTLYEEIASYEHQEPAADLEDSSQKVWVPDEAIEDLDSEPKSPFISPSDDDYILLLKNEPEDETEQKTTLNRKRKYKSSLSYANSSSDQSCSKVSTSTEDEFDIYGKYIASQLREMGLQRALRIQLQIQNIVSEARLDSLNDDN